MKHLSTTLLFALATFSTFIAHDCQAQSNDTKKVMVMNIDAEIDPRMNRYTKLALEHADEIEADIIMVEMDTYGGAVNDADDIRTRFLNYDKPLWVFINKDAASAGALISIACDSIYMAPGASIGAATVVVGGTGQAAPDKYQSYMRSIMRSTAEANKRNPKVAEAMVDENIDLDTLAPEGKVLTLSTSEAIRYDYCEAEESNIESILQRNGVKDYEIVQFELGFTEKVIRIFLNPFISGILILVIIGGIYFELQTPGVGFPLIASIAAMILYFIPYYLNGLADNWEIIVFFVGIGLLAVEAFVIPGFGIAGISGMLLVIGSLILVMINNDVFDFSFVDMDDFLTATATTMSSLLAGFILMIVGGVRLTRSDFFKNIALVGEQKRSEGYTSNFKTQSFIGKSGESYTVLRPSGRIIIDGEIYDAYTRGEYIAKGKKVKVIDESGTSLKVKEVENDTED